MAKSEREDKRKVYATVGKGCWSPQVEQWSTGRLWGCLKSAASTQLACMAPSLHSRAAALSLSERGSNLPKGRERDEGKGQDKVYVMPRTSS